jgi:hypothetical protein
VRDKFVLSFCILLAMFVVIGAEAQTNYSLGSPTALLNQDYYDGIDANGAGSSPTGRLAYFASPSKDGTRVAFWMVSGDFSEVAVFLVTVGQPDSWRRVTVTLASSPSAPIAWTPDDGYLLVGNLKIDVLTGSNVVTDYNGIALNDASTTSMPTGNWIATLSDDVSGQEQVALIPVFPNGDLDSSREITYVTNFAFGVGPFPDWPAISPDGARLAFADYQSIALGTPDHGDTYSMENIPAIVAAPKSSGQISSLAPVSAADPNVIAIRTNEGSIDNFAHVPVYTQDQSVIFFVEDWNNLFENDDYFATLALADFDVMLSNSDGSGNDVRFAASGSQFISSVTPGGVRVLYLEGNGTDFHLFMTSLETATTITGVTLGSPSDNVIQTGSDQTASDASGTAIVIAANTVIDFPDGGPQEIEIFTPVDPVTVPELPPGVEGIPVVRDFGPDGTTFATPIEVTIAYTDAEVADYIEGQLRVFQYNTTTMKFDIEVTTIVSRDTVNNEISFTIDHFSTFGLGGPKGAGMPVVGSIGLLLLLAGFVAILGAGFAQTHKRATNS